MRLGLTQLSFGFAGVAVTAAAAAERGVRASLLCEVLARWGAGHSCGRLAGWRARVVWTSGRWLAGLQRDCRGPGVAWLGGREGAGRPTGWWCLAPALPVKRAQRGETPGVVVVLLHIHKSMIHAVPFGLHRWLRGHAPVISRGCCPFDVHSPAPKCRRHRSVVQAHRQAARHTSVRPQPSWKERSGGMRAALAHATCHCKVQATQAMP